MSTYVVKLNLRIGAYEKGALALVEAATAAEAGALALRMEAHCDLGDGAELVEEDVLEDLHGEMVYEVYSVTLVDAADIGTLAKYLGMPLAAYE